MNVTINLVTEFNDIPKELAHMLKYVEHELAVASLSASDLSKRASVKHEDEETILTHGNEIMESFHDIRVHMAKIDNRMEDCMSILGGYVHYIENPPEEAPEEETQGKENEEG